MTLPVFSEVAWMHSFLIFDIQLNHSLLWKPSLITSAFPGWVDFILYIIYLCYHFIHTVLKLLGLCVSLFSTAAWVLLVGTCILKDWCMNEYIYFEHKIHKIQ